MTRREWEADRSRRNDSEAPRNSRGHLMVELRSKAEFDQDVRAQNQHPPVETTPVERDDGR